MNKNERILIAALKEIQRIVALALEDIQVDRLKSNVLKKWEKARAGKDRCVHTEHCCVFHGCKYGDEDCPVATERKTQSRPCERCYEDGTVKD